MKDITDKNFGVIIAFWLPGFLLLWGLSYSSPELSVWLSKSNVANAPTVAGFLYASLASLSAGLLISAVRWLVLDHFLHFWGTFMMPFWSKGTSSLTRPTLDMSRLADKDIFTAFNGAVENHYRYYQYYSNSLVAVTISFVSFAFKDGVALCSKLTFCAIIVGIALLLAAGDSLSKYHKAAFQLLT